MPVNRPARLTDTAAYSCSTHSDKQCPLISTAIPRIRPHLLLCRPVKTRQRCCTGMTCPPEMSQLTRHASRRLPSLKSLRLMKQTVWWWSGSPLRYAIGAPLISAPMPLASCRRKPFGVDLGPLALEDLGDESHSSRNGPRGRVREPIQAERLSRHNLGKRPSEPDPDNAGVGKPPRGSYHLVSMNSLGPRGWLVS